MTKSLKIVFYPIDAVGHVNAATGIAQVLIGKGHKVMFITSDKWKGKLEKYGIEEIIVGSEDTKGGAVEGGETGGEDAALHWANLMKKANAFTGLSPLERLTNVRKNLMMFEINDLMNQDHLLEQYFRDIKPDVIFTDQFLTVPAIENCGIPWVWWCSPNPLVFLDDERTPPGCSGLPSNGPKSEWKQFRDSVNDATKSSWTVWNNYIISKGLQPLDCNKYLRFSPFLNIYGFPEELDYTDIRPLPPNWCRFDNLKRTEEHLSFKIADQLVNTTGKLIYFSLGSMGGADIELMKRLIGILGKSKNRFIVSKGPAHKQLELAPNMWGQQSVPQIQVLPVVDLVITHGGNNTVTETFFFGKPMIVLPLFGDQHDNGQRIHEKGLGLRLNAHKCSEDELLTAIEKLLNDKQLNEKLQKISQRIQSENSIAKLPQIIENLVKTK